MLDVYVYYPRGPNLTPPRQVGQVQQPARYADDGAISRQRTPGREASEARQHHEVSGAAEDGHADTTDDAAGVSADHNDDSDDSGGHVDTFA